MIQREDVITLLNSYFPSEDCEIITRLADDVIRDIIPLMQTVVNDEKSITDNAAT